MWWLDVLMTALVVAVIFGWTIPVIQLMRVNKALAQLQRGAERFARGDLHQRINVTGSIPAEQLASAMNRMAIQLDDRLRTVIRHRNELEAIFGSMVEGVLAVDMDEGVISLNRTAAEMLHIDPTRALGRAIQEVVRSSALQNLVQETYHADGPTSGEIRLRLESATNNDSEQLIQAQGIALRDGHGHRVGAMLLLHDITQLRRLEGVRRDFVANVSHELRTPVTAIRGAIETILDEEEPMDPESQQHFLRIIGRQADRLHALIEDLLSLARIERATERQQVELIPDRIAPVLDAAVDTCHIAADNKQVTLQRLCEADLEAPINRPMLEQAVINLVDNAIKYSPDHTHVLVRAFRKGGEVVIEVQDQGPGIEPEYLPRIFERFYRTDRARARVTGGTGLGLAIVKHIAQAHSGRVSVESHPGSGSTFRIHLPASP